MKMLNVMTKARKRFGVEYPATETDYAIAYNDDKSITIYHKRQPAATFKVGDQAVADSYNLYYIGEIIKITEKTISIVRYKNTSNERTYRLGLNEFCWRNYDFSAERIAKENAETMQCI